MKSWTVISVLPTSLLTILWEPPSWWDEVRFPYYGVQESSPLALMFLTQNSPSQSDSEQLLLACVMLLCFFPQLLSQPRMFPISAHANWCIAGLPWREFPEEFKCLNFYSLPHGIWHRAGAQQIFNDRGVKRTGVSISTLKPTNNQHSTSKHQQTPLNYI